ncbi:hypothetical protein FQN52_006531 [Onygenales sp. PD_12]|nr:hypothetical protein FQN52_006531 [Onygenales sp. PD_12]
MGCGSSKQMGQRQQRPALPTHQRAGGVTIGRPTEVMIHLPRNRADTHGVPIPQTTHEIERPILENALAAMARFLAQKKVELTVIAVGGAVNTLLLRSRPSTHDVDIFGSNLNNDSRILLDEATQYAIRQSSAPLGTDWFNTENQMWLSPSLHRELTNEAMRQNVVVFHRPGLRVLAAPWEYAFSGKIARLLTGGSQIRPYDLADATHYLHQYISRNGGRPVTLATIEGWARRFNHSTSKAFLRDRVNVEYRKRYGRNGIA